MLDDTGMRGDLPQQPRKRLSWRWRRAQLKWAAVLAALCALAYAAAQLHMGVTHRAPSVPSGATRTVP